MAANWMRRTVLVAACVSAALLAACGSSTTDSAITPARFIAFGDANSDVGQNGSRYTVNDGSVNNWTSELEAKYGKSLTAGRPLLGVPGLGRIRFNVREQPHAR